MSQLRVSRGSGSWVAISLVCGACISGRATTKAYPLYDDGAGRRPRTEVATLVGHIRLVDDREVSDYGDTFDLLPGCHVIKLRERWRDETQDTSVIATLGDVYFVITMRAGYQYVVEIKPETFSSQHGKLQIRAREKDAQGNETEVYSPETNQAEIQACRASG